MYGYCLYKHIKYFNGNEARESRQLILVTQTLLAIMATLAHGGHFGDGSHSGHGFLRTAIAALAILGSADLCQFSGILV